MNAVIEERRGSVLILRLNNPPVNGLGAALRSDLSAAVAAGQGDNGITAFVLTGEGRMYSAGADIREFGSTPPADTPDLNDVINSLEMSTKPVVSAIHGVAAGGGLELALGTHYRVGAPKTRVGLPEVTLGILPGAGGTQRLPRIIDITKAMELITSGRLISVNEANTLGIIDEIAEGDPVEA
ncbi:MAG: enoyl-CoA hydratase/isomerase family protein, partial [Alphaproteobacteria bacterium]|nr:enoyl-CoA hydratase/isomerase family protein [Alphaproteobacteria bacterium]